MENDLISREDVITALIDADLIKTTAQQAVIAEVLNKIPSVKPKNGKWIDGYCSECGKSCLCDGWGIDYESKYCPNCGSYNAEIKEKADD